MPKFNYPKGHVPPIRLSADQKRKAAASEKSTVNKRVQGKANRLSGQASEQLALYAMKAIGLKAIFKLVNEWIPLRDKTGKLVSSKPGVKRPGDFMALTPDARGVLIEVKSATSRKRKDGTPTLPYSRIEPHQHDRLAEFANAGGLSLIAWTSKGEVRFYQYPNPYFYEGKAITSDTPQFKPSW